MSRSLVRMSSSTSDTDEAVSSKRQMLDRGIWNSEISSSSNSSSPLVNHPLLPTTQQQTRQLYSVNSIGNNMSTFVPLVQRSISHAVREFESSMSDTEMVKISTLIMDYCLENNICAFCVESGDSGSCSHAQICFKCYRPECFSQRCQFPYLRAVGICYKCFLPDVCHTHAKNVMGHNCRWHHDLVKYLVGIVYHHRETDILGQFLRFIGLNQTSFASYLEFRQWMFFSEDSRTRTFKLVCFWAELHPLTFRHMNNGDD